MSSICGIILRTFVLRTAQVALDISFSSSIWFKQVAAVSAEDERANRRHSIFARATRSDDLPKFESVE